MPHLTTEEMNADFGMTYSELKNEYPNWSKALHENGNVLETDDLKKIFCRGLLLWYIRYCLKKVGLTAFDNIDNNVYSSYYEIKQLIIFFSEIDKQIVNQKLLDLTQYKSYQELMLTDKTNLCASFKKYIIKHNLAKDVDLLILEKKKYDEIYFNITSGIKLEQFIYYELLTTRLVKLGIAFQRWKIILEKMCEYKNNEDDTYLKNIYLIDKFLEILQEMILHEIKTYINKIKKMFGCEINCSNKKNIIYEAIFDVLEKSDILIEKVYKPEKICDQVLNIINSFFEKIE